jgi:hypothetical protein
MAYREYRDSHHVLWRVWEVIPLGAERRRLRDRRGARRGAERRKRHEPRLALTNGAVDGWLVFESAHEKWRLRPIPVGWFERSDRVLEALGRTGIRAARVTPRLIE